MDRIRAQRTQSATTRAMHRTCKTIAIHFGNATRMPERTLKFILHGYFNAMTEGTPFTYFSYIGNSFIEMLVSKEPSIKATGIMVAHGHKVLKSVNSLDGLLKRQINSNIDKT